VPLCTSGGLGVGLVRYFGLGLKNLVLFTSLDIGEKVVAFSAIDYRYTITNNFVQALSGPHMLRHAVWAHLLPWKRTGASYTSPFVQFHNKCVSLHCAQCNVIGPVCLWMSGWVCYDDNSKLRASILTKLGL